MFFQLLLLHSANNLLQRISTTLIGDFLNHPPFGHLSMGPCSSSAFLTSDAALSILPFFFPEANSRNALPLVAAELVTPILQSRTHFKLAYDWTCSEPSY